MYKRIGYDENGNATLLEDKYGLTLDGANISEEELAEYTQTIKELNSQLSTYKATYDADSAKWAQTLEAYKKAALDYKWSDNTKSTLYKEVENAINDYNDAVIIPDKDFVSTTLNILTWQVMVVFWIVVVALPLAILALGVIVWARRRHL